MLICFRFSPFGVVIGPKTRLTILDDSDGSSALQWCEGDTHSGKPVLRILHFDFPPAIYCMTLSCNAE